MNVWNEDLLTLSRPLPRAQVFDDPSGRRLRWLYWGFGVGGAAVVLVALLLTTTLLHGRWAGVGVPVEPVSAVQLLPIHRDPAVMNAWLDTLEIKGRRAAFRVAGTDALRDPELLARLLAAGHAIVAAPYSGRPSFWLSPGQKELELAATQMLLAGVLGSEAVWADCGDDVNAELAQRLLARGLHCVPVSLLVPSYTARQSAAGAALRLAATLSASPAADCRPALGAPPAGLLPAAPVHRWIGRAVQGMLGVLDGLLRGAVIVALVMFVIFLLRFCWISHSMLRRSCAKAMLPRQTQFSDPLPAVCVIVPAYNEEAVVVATVRSVLGCRYPIPVQVIVVDDGSTDRTLVVVRAAFEDHPQVQVLTKPNGGKSSALNLGVASAHTPVVVCIDADTQLDPYALDLLCRHFQDPEIGAVAGNPKVGNRRNLLTRIQALEYVVIDSVERQAMERLNAITCITGALGAYRRSQLMYLGGFLPDTLAEDNDMTLRLLRNGARVVYEDDAVAWTEAPETLRDFMKQRFRWMFGTVQTAFKHRASLFAAREGRFGLIAMPNLLLLQVGLGCLLVPLIDVVGLLVLACLFLNGWVGWLFPHLQQLLQLLDEHKTLLYGLFGMNTLAGFGMAAIALRLDGRERVRSLIWFFPMQAVLRVLLGITAYRSIQHALSGRSLGWGSLRRTGHVTATPASTTTATTAATSELAGTGR